MIIVLAKDSQRRQKPEQMNRFTGIVTEKAEERRGRKYLNTRKNPRRQRKDYLYFLPTHLFLEQKEFLYP